MRSPHTREQRRVFAGAVAVLVLCVGLFFGVRAVRRSFAGAGQVAETAHSGQMLRDAILTYHARHGRFPARLEDVIQDGLADGAMLHAPGDTDPRPLHISWQYAPPPENAPPSAPLLRLRGASGGALVVTLGGQVQAQP